MKFPAVREAAVVGETVTAFIAANEAISKDSLSRHCQRQLASYKIPSRYVFLGNLPKKSSGKLNKVELLKRLK